MLSALLLAMGLKLAQFCDNGVVLDHASPAIGANTATIAACFVNHVWYSPMTEQPNNPLHGITLKDLLTELVDRYGWEELARRVNINCFKKDPSIKSSLTFLRRTPWARTEVEALYVRLKNSPWHH